MTVNTGALWHPHNKLKEEQLLHHDLHFLSKKILRFLAVNKSNSRLAVGSDRVAASAVSHGIKECFWGKSVIFSPLEEPEKQGRQGMTGANKEDIFHVDNMIVSLGSGNAEGFTGGSDEENLFNREPKRSHLSAEGRGQLIDVLAGLARLDECGIFLDSVEYSFAPNYSRTIGGHMSFSMMCKKIQLGVYTSWKSFVEDFECICYNVMTYNQKCPKIWDAANSMLHQGRAYLEEWAEKADKIFGCPSRTEEQNGCQGFEFHDNVDGSVGNAVIQKMKQNAQCVAEFMDSAQPGRSTSQSHVKNVVPLLGTDASCLLPTDDLPGNNLFSTSACMESLCCRNAREENMSQTAIKLGDPSGMQLVADDSEVDIIECTGDDIRFGFAEQATECSSSFEGTDIDFDYDSGCKETHGAAEVESPLQNVNRVPAAAEDFGSAMIKGNKKPLSHEWKAYRHGIGWRCQWLELQINKLQSLASQYNHILDKIQAKKLGNNDQYLNKASTPRVVPLICGSHRQCILRRKRRKKVEDMGNLVTYMSQHPLFSLYEKKKRMDADGNPVANGSNNMPREQTRQCSTGELKSNRSDESDSSEHLEGRETTDYRYSMELMLWKVENLQSRIFKMKNQLNELVFRTPRKNSSKIISHRSSSLESSKGMTQNFICPPSRQTRSQMPVGGDWKLQSGSSHCRRRVSDFDISNVTMLGNTVATYVEPARHSFIETPRWHLIDKHMTLDPTGIEHSSEEVTDDEVYIERHRYMELREKNHRGFLQPHKKLPGSNGIFGKRNPKTGSVQTLGAIDSVSVSATESFLRSNILPLDLCIPKGKRKKKKCRSSFLQSIEL